MLDHGKTEKAVQPSNYQGGWHGTAPVGKATLASLSCKIELDGRQALDTVRRFPPLHQDP